MFPIVNKLTLVLDAGLVEFGLKDVHESHRR